MQIINNPGWLIALFLLAPSRAGDWPQFLGPNRNGTSPEKIADSWKVEEPKLVWKKPVGQGFAGPVVSGKTVVLHHRQENSEILEAFDSETGASKWRSRAPTSYRDDFGFDEGPRAVPCVEEERIYSMGAEGLVRCVDLKEGKELWSVPTKTRFNARKGFFGMVCSPLIEGPNVILNIGGESGAGVVALDKNTGKLRWKTRDDEASYASPVTALLDGKRELLVYAREALAALEPESGQQIAEFSWRSRMQASVNAATPLVVSNMIFLTASYGTGAALLQWQNNTFKKLWSNDDSLSAHYATPVYQGGYLYGFHGRQEYGASFRCIELKNGKVKWRKDGLGAGTVTLVGGNLLILTESGELVIAKASSVKYEETGRVHLLGSGLRAYPAFSDRRLYARDKNSFACISLP